MTTNGVSRSKSTWVGWIAERALDIGVMTYAHGLYEHRSEILTGGIGKFVWPTSATTMAILASTVGGAMANAIVGKTLRRMGVETYLDYESDNIHFKNPLSYFAHYAVRGLVPASIFVASMTALSPTAVAWAPLVFLYYGSEGMGNMLKRAAKPAIDIVRYFSGSLHEARELNGAMNAAYAKA